MKGFDPLALLSLVAAVAGTLGIAYAVFTSAKVQKTVDLYKLENEAQGRRIATLEEERTRTTERLAAVEKENLVLRDLATGRSVMEALAKDYREAEAVRKTEHDTMMRLLSDIQEAIQEMWQGISRLLGQGR